MILVLPSTPHWAACQPSMRHQMLQPTTKVNAQRGQDDGLCSTTQRLRSDGEGPPPAPSLTQFHPPALSPKLTKTVSSTLTTHRCSVATTRHTGPALAVMAYRWHWRCFTVPFVTTAWAVRSYCLRCRAQGCTIRL